MTNKVILIFVLTIFFSFCKEKNSLKNMEVVEKNLVLNGSFRGDSLINGIVKYYSGNGHLKELTHYSNGKKDGPSLKYFESKIVSDSCSYSNGLLHGNQYKFDSMHNLTFQYFYFNGKSLGANCFYKDGKPYIFVYRNFENNPLFRCSYDSTGKIFRFGGEIINSNTYRSNSSDSNSVGIFSYFIYPPTVSVKYSLGLIEDKTDLKRELIQFNTEKVFFDSILPLPESKWNYYLAADYNDSQNNFHEYYITVLKHNLSTSK